MLAHTRHQHDSSEQAFDFQSTAVLLGEYWPTEAVLERPIRLVGDKLAPAALEKGWNRYAAPGRLRLPYPRLTTGFEIMEQPAKFADARNRIQPLKEFRDALTFCPPEAAKDLGEFGSWLKKNEPKLDEPPVGKEFAERVRGIARKHEPLLAVLDPHQEAKTQVREKQDVFDILAAIDAKTTTTALVERATQRLVETQQAIDADGEALRQDFANHVAALAALSLFSVNGGGEAPVYIVNCRDVNEMLALHRAELVQLLSSLRSAHHVDVGILNPVAGGTESLKKLGEELDRKLRGCVWATLGGVAGEAHAIKIAESNPVVASEGAGSVFAFVGMAQHRGYPAVISAAALGKRLALDRRHNDDEAGPMTPSFGPQASKHLLGIDELDTLDWSIETLKMLAKEAGLNVVMRHSNGVVSPYLGRTLSSLEHYRFIDGSRLANMLTGFVMAYLDVAAPGKHNTPSVQRAVCERAEEKFFTPFKDRSGFSGSLQPLATSKGTRFDLALQVQSPDPIEEIVVIQRHVPIRK